MNLMIASDLHGSAYYGRLLLEAFEREQPQRLLLLGDLLYHGPRNDLPRDYDPKQGIALLNSIKEYLLCVRGNCDCDVDQMVLEFPIMAESCLFYVENHMIFATHGHLYSPQTPPLLQKGDVLLTGHTHVPACTELDGFTYLNPGSLAIPKQGSCHGYMVLEDGVFFLKDLQGAVQSTYKLPPRP